MPKKRSYQFKAIQNQTSPSSSSRDTSVSTRTVNERLSQLRAEQAPRPTIEQRNEITTLATSHTLPPHLRRILDVPETAPPLPLRGSRRIMRLNGRRLPPGPAAPQSWLAASLHAPARAKAEARRHMQASMSTKQKPRMSRRFANLDDVHPLPTEGSLIDHTLRSMAQDWEFISQYEQLNLATLPIRWKTALLSYLGAYAPVGSVTIDSLKTLFLAPDELDDATGGDELVRLDLSGLVPSSFSLLEFEKFLYRTRKTDSSIDELLDAKLKLDENAAKASAEVAESWEDEAEAKLPSPTLGLNMKIKRCPNLTRLSLAHAGPHASWRGLISLTGHLPTLTHLSLASWPIPTMTPNSKTAFITHNHAPIPVSGTHFYNRLDDDWAEASSILKHLSRNTYRLQWLDLEGCPDWIPALTWCAADERGQRDRWVDRTFRRSSITSPNPHNMQTLSGDDEFPASRNIFGPDWNGSWSQLTYVNISQGIIPRDINSVRAYPAGVVAAELLLWLRDDDNTQDKDVARSKGVDVQQWLQREKEARIVERTVRALRSSVGGRYCEFDHGWTRPMAASAAILKSSKANA